MKSYIWDTGALSLYFAGHLEANKIMDQIEEKRCQGYVPLSVLSEFYYKSWQKFGKQAAQLRTMTILNSNLKEISFKQNDIFAIGELKVKYTKLSFVDCVVLTLGKKIHGIILTTDEDLQEVRKAKVKKFEY